MKRTTKRFIYSILLLMLCGFPLRAQSDDPYLIYENVYVLQVKITHDASACQEKKNYHHAFRTVSGEFLPEEDFSCYNNMVFIATDEASAGENTFEGSVKIPLHGGCESYFTEKFYASLPASEQYEREKINLEAYKFRLTYYAHLNNFSGYPVTEGNGEGAVLYNPSSNEYVYECSMRQMLRSGLKVTMGCETAEIKLVPLCQTYIGAAETVFQGYPYTYYITARSVCSGDYYTTDSVYFWEYYNEGKPVAFKEHASRLALSMDAHPEWSFGQNIVVRMLNGLESNSKNTRVVNFYPTIPQPTRTGTQRIPTGSDILQTVTLRFDRQLEKKYQEKLTKITIYSEVGSVNAAGISESKVYYQKNVDITELSSSLTYEINLAPYYITEGTYYVTVEGTAMGRGNHPDSTTSYPDEVRNAMFSVVRLYVSKMEVNIYDLKVIPPLCHGDSATIQVYMPPTGLTTSVKFYWVKDDGGQEVLPFTTIKGGNILSGDTSIYQYSKVTHELRRLKIKVSTATAPSLPGIGQGVFASTSSDSDCESEFDISYTDPEALSVPVSKRDISGQYGVNGIMYPSNDGYVFVNRKAASGGTPPYKFFYTVPVQPAKMLLNTDTLRNTSETYRVFLEDANACGFDTSLTIGKLNKYLDVKIIVENPVSCKGLSDGILQVVLGQVNVPLVSYRWYKNGERIPGAFSDRLEYAGAGHYRIEAQCMQTGMTSYYEIDLPEPSELAVKSEKVEDNLCFGERKGKISVTATGGTPLSGSTPYIYTWNDGTFAQARNDLPAGVHTLQIMDSRGCYITKSYTVGEPDAPFRIVVDSVIDAYYDANDVWCPGGVITHATGGTRTYGSLTTEPSVESTSAMNPGKYRLVQYDKNLCEAEAEIEIGENARLEIAVVQEDSVLCFGQSQASCRVDIAGGIPPYTIQWSNGGTTKRIADLKRGDYSVTVTDRVGAKRTAGIRIDEPALLQVRKIEAKNPTYGGCVGSDCEPDRIDGVLRLEVSGGSLPYNFEWKRDGETLSSLRTSEAEGLAGGFYQVDVTDRNACYAQHFEILQRTPPLSAKVRAEKEIFCYGDSSGVLSSEVSGGHAPYVYEWFRIPDPARIAYFDWDERENSVGGEAVLSDVPSGYYGLKVLDSNGVAAKTVFRLAQRNAMEITVDDIKQPSYACSLNGELLPVQADGEIAGHIAGGTMPYRWILGTETGEGADFAREGLDFGAWRFQVYDSAGCRFDTVFELPFVHPLLCDLQIADSISCRHASDGELEVVFSGGLTPYTGEWLRGGEVLVAETVAEAGSLSLPALPTGTYAFRLTDAKGVVSFSELSLPEPDTLVLHTRFANSPCFADSTAFVAAEAEGGSLPYTWRWQLDGRDVSPQGLRLEGLENGSVEIDVEDKRGCRASAQLVLQAPEALRLTSQATDPSYRGTFFRGAAALPADGEISVQAYGGTKPYRVRWYRGADTYAEDTALVLRDLDTGFYRIVVTDAHGCFIEDSFRLGRIPALSSGLVQCAPVRCYKTFSAALRAEAVGGVPPYRYRWFKNGKWFSTETDTLAEQLGEGTYTLEITDINGIISLDSLYISQPDPLQWKSHVTPATAWQFNNGGICTEVQGGTHPYYFQWEELSHDSCLLNVGRGIYTLNFRDSMGCTFTESVEVPSPDSLYVLSYDVAQSRPDSLHGSIRLHISGGLKPYEYLWKAEDGSVLERGKTSESLIGIASLKPGLYAFSLRDSGGAEIHTLYEVQVITDMTISLFISRQPDCYGSADAVLESRVQGGKLPYRYVWEKWIDGRTGFILLPDTGAVLRDIPAGQYRLFAYDSSDQTVCAMTFVHNPVPISVSNRLLYNPDLPEDADGEVLVWAQGGTPPYTYTWNDTNLKGENIFIRSEEHYILTVTDAKSCETQHSLDGLLSENMEIEIVQTASVLCHNEETAALQVKIRYGRSPFKIRWSNGATTASVENLGAGTYTVEVEDALGKVCRAEYTVVQPPAIFVESLLQHPSCYGSADGGIEIGLYGGTGVFSLLWNTGGENTKLENLSSGRYELRAYDANNCLYTDTFELRAPSALYAVTQIDPVECPYGSGGIRLGASGGTSPYIYAWDFYSDSLMAMEYNKNDNREWKTSSSITPAAPGYYFLSVRDEHHCQWDTMVNLTAPPYPEYEVDSVRYLCLGQSIDLGVRQGRNADNTEYIWTYPDGSTSFDAQIRTTQAGTHGLLMIQDGKCFYRDSVPVEGFSDSIYAEFWMSSNILAEQSCMMVNISRYTSDSTVWHLPEEVTVLETGDNYVEVSFPGPGNYLIGMTTYKGLCTETVSKNVQVVASKGFQEDTLSQGVSAWRIYPNPTRGVCRLAVTSPSDIQARYRIVSSSGGQTVEQGELHIKAGDRFTAEILRESLPSGLYIMMVEYGKVRRGFKIIKQ